MTEKRPAQEFIDMIMAEGGVWGAIEYGLNPADYELPDQIAEAWREIRKIGRAFDHATEDFEQMTKDAGLEWE